MEVAPWACTINLETLLRGCDGDSFDDGIRLDTELEPLAGSGSPVKPAVYKGGVYINRIAAGPRPRTKSLYC